MIPAIVAFITHREGKKFLKLSEINEAVIKPPAAGEVSLYIHIPFCRTLCPFCCFNRYLFHEDEAHRYFQSLRKELDLYINKGFRFSDFYFGGGTPTILMDELAGFVSYVKHNFEVKRISLETTPREISPETVAALQTIGVNRLSIGVQSFDEAVLKDMGRLATSSDNVREKLLMAQGKFDTLNIDFVFNFPAQTLASFMADVRTFRELGIDQATFYPLMASPHKKSAMERKFQKVDFSREKDFYNIILDEVYDRGYKASTAWCFSRGERMIDEYIIDFDDYIGIGSGSVSILNGNFFVNTFSLEKYDSLLKDNKLPLVGWRPLSERENLRYYLLTKLFGMSMDESKFRERFSAGISEKLGLELAFLKLGGVVRQDNGKIVVTRKGMYPVSVMMREFFAALNGLRELYIEKQI